MVWNKDKSISVLTSLNAIRQIDEAVLNAEYIAVDTETNGLGRFAKVIQVSIATSEDVSFTIPLEIWKNDKLISPWSNESAAIVKSHIKKWLTNKKNLILHNCVFDAKVIETSLGLNILPFVFCDTILLAHTAYSEEGPFALKTLAAELLDKDASLPQEDVKASVKANGGTTTKDNFEMYKCDFQILAKYAAYDVLYTYGLFNRLYPELEKQQLLPLWHEEVMPLIHVIHELNTTGININVPYFEQLKVDTQAHIASLEESVYTELKDQLVAYEVEKVLKKYPISPQSGLGKYLMEHGLEFNFTEEEVVNKAGKPRRKKTFSPKQPLTKFHQQLQDFYCKKASEDKGKEVRRVFSFDSGDDKAFLLFDVLDINSTKKTKGGKRAVDRATLDEMLETLEESHPASTTINQIVKRNKEIKILGSYINPFLDNHIDGVVYANFMQTGTSSGRLSCKDPISFQTFPRKDLRIKKGIIPPKDWVIVNADYSSLEPRSFASVSEETELQRVYKEGLDLYSYVYILLFGEDQYSAKEGDDNFLKALNPDARQDAKEYTLGFVYGMSEFKLSKILNIPLETAKDIKDKYFETFPNLQKYMETKEKEIYRNGYVTNIMGRRKRAKLVPYLKKRFDFTSFDYRDVQGCFDKCKDEWGFIKATAHLDTPKKPKTGKDLAKLVRNEIHNAFNFPIQSLAGSITNAACIQLFKQKAHLRCKMVLQVHDEITLYAHKDDAKEAGMLLQKCMEHNMITKMLDVPMEATPIITDKNLSEAK